VSSVRIALEEYFVLTIVLLNGSEALLVGDSLTWTSGGEDKVQLPPWILGIY